MKKQISIVWDIDDVKTCGELVGFDNLTDEQCSEILEIVEDEHDATIGVNFDVIGIKIQEYMSELVTDDEDENEEIDH